jgi:hypothetical protein
VDELDIAFALSAVENLVLDIGFKIPFAVSKSNPDATRQEPFHAAVGATFKSGDFNILGRVDLDFLGSTTLGKVKTTDAPNLNIHVVPSYNLGFATVGGEVGFIWLLDSKETGGAKDVTHTGGVGVGAGAWIQKSWGAGYIKAGLAYKLGTKVYEGDADTTTDDVYTRGTFSVPIVLQYAF